MKKVLFIIANLTAFCSAMAYWQCNLFFRIAIYDVLSMLFIGVFFLYYSIKENQFLIRKELKYFMLFQWGSLFMMFFSGLKVMFFSTGEKAFIQYFKGISSVSVQVLFFTLFILYLSDIKAIERKKILIFYIAGVICSCVYGMAQMLIYKNYGFDIQNLWSYVSYNTNYDFENITWAVMGVTRGVGFPGIDTAATYVVTVLPLLLIIAFNSRKIKDMLWIVIAILGLLVTMSRTGLASFAVAFLLLIILERRQLLGFFKAVFIISIPLGYLAYVWSEYISEILKFRTQIDSIRFGLFKGGMALFYENPILGVGASNYSVARFTLPDNFFHDANVHNSWLTILIELGIVGMIFYIAYFFYVLKAAFLRKSMFSNAFICGIIGLLAGALFNQVFDTFYFKFFTVLFFTSIILKDIPFGYTGSKGEIQQ